MHYARFRRHGDPLFVNPVCNRDGNARARRKEYLRAWKNKNKDTLYAYIYSRKRRVRQATPPWVDLDAIRDFYFFCPEGYHVDHIIPINHPRISGLHILWNLQYLPGADNLLKSNALPVDLPGIADLAKLPRRAKEISPETRQRLRDAAIKRYSDPNYVNPNIGQRRTEEQKLRIREGQKARDLPTGEAWHKAHGGQYTDEVKAKMRAAKLGKKPANTKKVQCIETGQVFDGLSDAAKALNVNRQSIYLQIKGKLKSAGGLHFRYLE